MVPCDVAREAIESGVPKGLLLGVSEEGGIGSVLDKVRRLEAAVVDAGNLERPLEVPGFADWLCVRAAVHAPMPHHSGEHLWLF